MTDTRIAPPAHASRFLAAAGWPGARIETLAADASFRRYFRVWRDGQSAVLMDAPPEKEDSRPFLAVAHWLRNQGLRAPQIHAADLDDGLALLEDFGDHRLGPYLRAAPGEELARYRDAIAVLAKVQAPQPPHRLGYHAKPADGSIQLDPYDAAVMRREVDLLIDWFAPACDIALDDAALDSWRQAWADAWGFVLEQQRDAPVLVLRDYHADNLMILPGEDALVRLGLLDFQDALAGHPAYDLVSLLQDARRDVPAALEAEMLIHYWSVAPEKVRDIGWPQFHAAYQLLGCQRNIKIIGIFTRLHRRDGKPFYPTLQPRVWGYVARNLAHPALHPVRSWLDRYIAEPLRVSSPV